MIRSLFEKIRKWFHREPEFPPGWSLRMTILLLRHRHIRFVKDEKLYEVNQNLTQLLLNEELIFLKDCEGSDELYVKRHQLVAQQLEELHNLRGEIKEVYRDLDRRYKK